MIDITTIDRIKNYNGENSFVLSVKKQLIKTKNLSAKQISVSDEILKYEYDATDMENLSENLKKIVDYNGKNKLIKRVQDKFLAYHSLSSTQIDSTILKIEKEIKK